MSYRILIVEDHDDTREITRALLVHHGYLVFEAVTAEEMLEKIDDINPDLIILDVRLPGMDGCAGLEKLREAGYRQPVFLFSEYFDLFRERIHTCRPDGFFPKSKGPLELITAIQSKLPPASSSA